MQPVAKIGGLFGQLVMAVSADDESNSGPYVR